MPTNRIETSAETQDNTLSFFTRTGARLVQMQHDRSKLAADIFNRCAVPSDRFKLNARNVHLFSPHARAKFSGFEDINDFGNDLRSAILKPCIFIALAAWEYLMFWADIISIPLNLFTSEPMHAADKAIDAVQSLLVRLACEFWVTVETFLQLGSLVMRSGLSIKEALVPNNTTDPTLEADSGDDEMTHRHLAAAAAA